jgi:hypothetical protein
MNLEEIDKIRQKCPHFRVLVVGKTNSGKTTLLKAVCRTSENPEIRNPTDKGVGTSLMKTVFRAMGPKVYSPKGKMVGGTHPSFDICCSSSQHKSSVIEPSNDVSSDPLVIDNQSLMHVRCYAFYSARNITSTLSWYSAVIQDSFSMILVVSRAVLKAKSNGCEIS